VHKSVKSSVKFPTRCTYNEMTASVQVSGIISVSPWRSNISSEIPILQNFFLFLFNHGSWAYRLCIDMDIGAGFPRTYFPVMCTKRVSLCACLCVDLCIYVCSLITWEQEERLSPSFQGSSRVPQGWF